MAQKLTISQPRQLRNPPENTYLVILMEPSEIHHYSSFNLQYSVVYAVSGARQTADCRDAVDFEVARLLTLLSDR